MKRIFKIGIYTLFGVLLITSAPSQGFTDSSCKKAAVTQNDCLKNNSPPDKMIHVGEVPLYFIPNRGQVEKRALFYASTKKYTLWITPAGLLYDSFWSNNESGSKSHSSENQGAMENQLLRSISAVRFLGVDENTEVEAVDISDYTVSYFLGSNPSEWKTGIQTSKAVVYKDLYQNIDLKLYGKENQLEYDWVVKPGGNPEQIRLAIEGVKQVEVNEDGYLVVETSLCRFVHKKPLAFQMLKDEKREVEAEFKKIGKNTYGFSIGQYNPKHELVIDPIVLVYSTFFGGSDLDQAHDIDTDGKGRPYITGYTSSINFPTTLGVYNLTLNGKNDVFITKFNAAGTDPVYSTFLGGGDDDGGYGIFVDSKGYAYIVGATYSADFPTTSGVYDSSFNGKADAFVAKLNKKGSALVFSTFIGGSAEDYAYGITLGSDEAVYLTGATESADFPTTIGADDRTFGGVFDGFVAKMNPTLSSLVYSTYVGDIELERFFDITIDLKEAAYVTGYIDYDGEKNTGDSDVLVVKLNPKGSAQIYSFVFGGTDDEWGRGIAVDSKGFTYIVGWTGSSNFPTTPNAFDPTYNGHIDVFVSKLKKAGSGFVYSTYLGGSCGNWGEDIDLYEDLSAIVTGYTTDPDFPVTYDAFDKIHNGQMDAFVSKLNPPGSDLDYSTFLGGASDDFGKGIAVDINAVAHVTGYSFSPAFPTTPGAYDKKHDGVSDAFYVKFALEWPISIKITSPVDGAKLAGTVTIDTEVSSEEEVSDVQFFINDVLVYQDIVAPYRFDWDTSSLANRTYDIEALASDTQGNKAYAQITVHLLNGTLDLQVQRGVYKTWLFRKGYAKLFMSVLKYEIPLNATRFIFYRKKQGEDYLKILDMPVSELQGYAYAFTDMPLEVDATYIYYAIAVTETGEIIGITEQISI